MLAGQPMLVAAVNLVLNLRSVGPLAARIETNIPCWARCTHILWHLTDAAVRSAVSDAFAMQGHDIYTHEVQWPKHLHV